MVRVKGDLINDEILSRKYNHYLHKEIELKCKSNAEKWRMCAKVRNVKYEIKQVEKKHMVTYVKLLRQILDNRLELEQTKYELQQNFDDGEMKLKVEELTKIEAEEDEYKKQLMINAFSDERDIRTEDFA